jgi:hypothetical protein
MKTTVMQLVAAAAATAMGFSALAQTTGLQLVVDNVTLPDGAGTPGGQFAALDGEYVAKFGIDNAAVDNNGNVIFRGQLDISGIGTATTANRFFIGYGAPGALQMLARDGAGNPHLANPNNWSHNSTTNSTGIQGSIAMTSNGTIMVSSNLNGSGATTNTTSAFWTGPANNLQLASQRGVFNNVIPNSSGATINQSMTISTSQNRINGNGKTFLPITFTGGNVSGTTNNDGMFIVSPSGLTQIMRKNDIAPGLGDATLRFGASSSFGQLINSFDEVAFPSPLLTGSGTTPVTTTNNDVLWTNAGGSLTPIAREGGSQGLSGGLTWQSMFNGAPTASSPFGVIGFTNTHSFVFGGSVTGPGVTVGVNDQVLAKWNAGTVTPFLRKGDTCTFANANANWGGFSTSNSRAFGNGTVLLSGVLADNGSTTITTDNDEYIAMLKPDNSLTQIARDGALLTNFGSAANLGSLPADAIFFGQGSLSAGPQMCYNSKGQVIFQCSVAGTGITNAVNSSCIFAWDPNVGLILVARTGSILNPNMGALTQLSYNSTLTGDGTSQCFTDNWFAFKAADSFGNNAIYRTQIIPAPATALVGLGGLVAVGRRRRR